MSVFTFVAAAIACLSVYLIVDFVRNVRMRHRWRDLMDHIGCSRCTHCGSVNVVDFENAQIDCDCEGFRHIDPETLSCPFLEEHRNGR